MEKPLKLFVYKIRLLYETFEKPEVIKECLSWLKKNKNTIETPEELEDFLNKFNTKIAKFLNQKAWLSALMYLTEFY